MRVLLITNIITPYRQPLYNALAEEGRRRGVDLHVAFMARGEANRNWRPEDYSLSFSHTFYRGLHVPVPRRPVAAHANPGIWWTMLARRWDVVIIGGYDHFTSVVGGWLPGSSVKLLWCESGLFGPRPRGPVSNAIKRVLICRYDGYVVPGQRAKEYICSIRPSAKNSPFLLLPNVVNEELYCGVRTWSPEAKAAARRRWGLDPDRRVMVSVARQDGNKGAHRILEALRGVLWEPVTLVIVGDGPLMGRVKQLADSAHPVHVKLVGYQEQEPVAELLGLSDAFILSSLWDAGPMAMVEAAMAGLPIISTDRAGFCAELVKPDWNGWVFDPTDPESIRAGVTAFLETTDGQLTAMAVRSAELADKMFRISPGVGQFVDGLIELRRRGRPLHGIVA